MYWFQFMSFIITVQCAGICLLVVLADKLVINKYSRSFVLVFLSVKFINVNLFIIVTKIGDQNLEHVQ